jgi:hypothetical protein
MGVRYFAMARIAPQSNARRPIRHRTPAHAYQPRGAIATKVK